MEKIIEVSTKYGYDEYKKLNQFHMTKKKKAPRVFFFGCCAILVIMAILLIVFGEPLQGICYLAFTAAMLFFIIYMPTIATKRMMKSSSESGELENITTFYDEYIENKNPNNSIKIPYKDIFEIYETDSNVYIYVDRVSVYIVSKSNFIIGDNKKLSNLLETKVKDKIKIVK